MIIIPFIIYDVLAYFFNMVYIFWNDTTLQSLISQLRGSGQSGVAKRSDLTGSRTKPSLWRWELSGSFQFHTRIPRESATGVELGCATPNFPYSVPIFAYDNATSQQWWDVSLYSDRSISFCYTRPWLYVNTFYCLPVLQGFARHLYFANCRTWGFSQEESTTVLAPLESRCHPMRIPPSPVTKKKLGLNARSKVRLTKKKKSLHLYLTSHHCHGSRTIADVRNRTIINPNPIFHNKFSVLIIVGKCLSAVASAMEEAG